jgi:hypothetical protein
MTAMLVRMANEIDGYEHPQFRVSDTARLRALAVVMERIYDDNTIDHLRSAAAMLRDVATPTLGGDECVTACMSTCEDAADLLALLSPPP